jgi:ferredoxin
VTYIVNEGCIRCKYTDCVEVCPVDCFYEGENMLVIHPDECIDCGVCEPECPVDAIKPDTEPGLEKWLDINRQYSAVWPNITRKKPAPPDADAFVNVPDKFAKYFSPNPGEGDQAVPVGNLIRVARTLESGCPHRKPNPAGE